jgi:hypothetical protein
MEAQVGQSSKLAAGVRERANAKSTRVVLGVKGSIALIVLMLVLAACGAPRMAPARARRRPTTRARPRPRARHRNRPAARRQHRPAARRRHGHTIDHRRPDPAANEMLTKGPDFNQSACG